MVEKDSLKGTSLNAFGEKNQKAGKLVTYIRKSLSIANTSGYTVHRLVFCYHTVIIGTSYWSVRKFHEKVKQFDWLVQKEVKSKITKDFYICFSDIVWKIT